MKLKSIIFLFSAIILVFVCVMLDFKHANLTYIGDVKINPAIDYYRPKSYCSWIASKGRNLRQRLENGLFPEIKIEKLKNYSIEWGKNIKIVDDEIYYACIGCEIKNISYFYHTKLYFNRSNFDCFKPHSVEFNCLSDKDVIKIYRGNISISGI